jgi:hypothetical protein
MSDIVIWKSQIGMTVTLSLSALKNIRILDTQQVFIFVVGDIRHHCSPIIAQFLSPQACLHLSVDPSMSEYVVETKSLNDEFHIYIFQSSGMVQRLKFQMKIVILLFSFAVARIS